MTAAKLALNPFDSPGGPRAEAQITELDAPESFSDPRRAHTRFGVDLEVSLGSEHNFYAGLAENISAGGVFIATHMVKPVGDLLDLTIHFPDEERVVRAIGEVRWVREYNDSNDVPPGMGVRWRDLSDEDAEQIERFSTLRPPLFFDDE